MAYRQTNPVERLVKRTLRQIEVLSAPSFSIGDTVVADRGPKVFPQYATGVIIEQQDSGYVIQFRESDGGGVETHKASRLTLLKAAPKNASNPVPPKPRTESRTPRTRVKVKQPAPEPTLFTQNPVPTPQPKSPGFSVKAPVPQVAIKTPGIFSTDIFKNTATFWDAYQRGAADNKIGLVLNSSKPKKTPGDGWEHENKFAITSVEDPRERYALSAYLGFLARYIQQTKQFEVKSVGGNINQRGELYGTFIFSRKPGTGAPLTIRISHTIKVADTLWGVSAEPVSSAAGGEDATEKWLKSVKVPVSDRVLKNAETFLAAVNKYSFGTDKMLVRSARPKEVQGYQSYDDHWPLVTPEDGERADRISSYLAELATSLKKTRQFTVNISKGSFSDTALTGAVKFERDDGLAIILLSRRLGNEHHWAIMAK